MPRIQIRNVVWGSGDSAAAELRAVAQRAGLAVSINQRKRERGEAAIELREICRRGEPPVAVFKKSGKAIEWIQGGQQRDDEQQP